MVCVSVLEDNPRTLASELSPVQMHTPYSNLLTAPACCIARYLTLNIRIPMKGTMGRYNILFVLLYADDTVVLGILK